MKQIHIHATEHKRYFLSLDFDNNKSEQLLVILKNPSRANKELSDKTVFNVCNYIYKNRTNDKRLENIGSITIVNLMPHYLTDSSLLEKHKADLIDRKNLEIIDTLCQKISKIIIAWGNHPKGLYDDYELLKSRVFDILKTQRNEVFYVKQLSLAGNPRHGQVWGYQDPIIKFRN